MSEGNERNLESIAPEAAENVNIEQKEEAVQATDVAEASGEMNAPAQKKSGGKKKKKRKKNNILVALVIVLVAVLVVFGVLVGYGLGRVRNERNAEQGDAAEEQADEANEIQPYDAFIEELTQENQQALDALAGENGGISANAEALLGEEGLLGEDPLLSDELNGGEIEAAEPVVVAEFGDGQTLMSDEVLAEYYDQLSMYILSGYNEEDVAEMLLYEVMESMVSEHVLAEHAKEMGLMELTEEDHAEIEAQAKEIFEEYRTYYRDHVADVEGMTDEEANAAAEELMLEYEDITYDSLLAETEESWWEQKLYNAITASVTVDDAEIRADYEQRLAEQKESFTEFPEDYEFSQSNGEVIVYNLPGYRAVKVLTLGFEDPEAIVALNGISDDFIGWDDEEESEHQEVSQEELDGYYAAPEARAQEALEQLRAGADMDEMIKSIGADDDMLNERTSGMGYYVSSDSTLWPEAFISAAMALEEVGDYSEPVRTEEGVSILQYIGDVPEGEVPFEDVRDALAQEAQDSLRYRAYSAQVEAWLEEADPSYYPERMQ